MSNNPMIDIGVNLSNQRLLKRVDEIITRATKAGIVGMLLTGTDLKNSEELITLSNLLVTQYPQISLWSTAGVHPHDAETVVQGLNETTSWIDKLKEIHMNQRVVAVGECGLDFDRNYSPPHVQRDVFEQQLKLAVDIQKPLFLHQRGASKDFIDMLKTYAPQLPKRGEAIAAVVHCFTDDRHCLEQLLELGCYIGITGWIDDERRAQKLREAVRILPLDRVLIESDAPYLLPRTLRPKPKNGLNEPSYLPHIAKQLSHFSSFTYEEIVEKSFNNTLTLFGISLSS